MVGWVKMPRGTEVGLSPGHIVLDQDPAPPHGKGHSSPSCTCAVYSCIRINNGPCILWPNGWMDQDATWYGGKPQPGDIVLDGDPAPPPQKGAHHPTHTFWPMSIVAKRSPISWPPCIADADIIFLPCGFFYPSFFFLSFFPRLVSAVTEWMSTILLHMVWPYCEFRMQVWNVLLLGRWKYRTQKIAVLAPVHNFVGLYLCN